MPNDDLDPLAWEAFVRAFARSPRSPARATASSRPSPTWAC